MKNIEELISVLVMRIEEKDKYTKGHSDRVAEISTWICEAAGIDKKDLDEIHIAAHLHDIGKIHIPDTILNKTGSLLPREWEQVKRHPEVSYNMLAKISGFKHIAQMVLFHHERWDGKGYCYGIKGSEIPLGARIIAIADSIDAMMSVRPYRNPMSWSECMQQLKEGKGKQYDPELLPMAVNICKRNISSLYYNEQGR